MDNHPSGLGHAHGQEDPDREPEVHDNNDNNEPANDEAADNQPAQEFTEEYFWPILRKHALGKADPNDRPVKGICPICYDQVSIAGLPRPAEKGKECLIAPCGHIMCYECWPQKEYEDNGVDRAGQRKCPVCRLLIECECCGRGVIKERAPEYSCDAEDVDSVPRMIPETDIVYVPLCCECADHYIDGWWFKPRRPHPEVN
ncbi:hypothetical protein FSARC_2776 [Fusarium sarcochroum]|uniref:RING-type domain-containing protein n=1 Tax=Fusarium sarcochroum TaxID=1208366 RepID=A0A8H4U614_9HYPO|nr:hypothetical protein FSARC_2776 [Fusarium sarcochroum]